MIMSSDLKKSSLLDAQIELGAVVGEYFDWQMASTYGDSNREVKNVRENVGLCDLSYCGAIKATGSEAIQFLQGLVSNDVKALEKGKGMHAAFLTGHGKVRAFCYILGLAEGFLILTDPQTHEKVFKYVFPFSYAGDFPVEDVSEQFQLLALQGANSLLVLKESCFEPVPQLKEYEWVETIIAGQKVMIVNHSRTGEPGYDILVPQSGLKDVWDFLLLKGEFHSLAPFGLEALTILRIEAGLPEYAIDIDENNMLLESGFEDIVSFTKGCYTGQEAVAMATYRGHVSKKLSLLSLPQDAGVSVGNKVYANEKEIGIVSSVVKSETVGKTLALACIKYGFFDKGFLVEVETEQQRFTGEIITPYSNE
jgi:folate-binding protein YgfZ